ESVMAEQAEALDKALWVALRTLEERVALLRRLADKTRGQGRGWLAQSFEERAVEAERQASLLRQVLIQAEPESSMREIAKQEKEAFRDAIEKTDSDIKE